MNKVKELLKEFEPQLNERIEKRKKYRVQLQEKVMKETVEITKLEDVLEGLKDLSEKVEGKSETEQTVLLIRSPFFKKVLFHTSQSMKALSEALDDF